MAALTRSGARKASEIVMLIFRALQFSREAIAAIEARRDHLKVIEGKASVHSESPANVKSVRKG